jgi:hypothetical protein
MWHVTRIRVTRMSTRMQPKKRREDRQERDDLRRDRNRRQTQRKWRDPSVRRELHDCHHQVDRPRQAERPC